MEDESRVLPAKGSGLVRIAKGLLVYEAIACLLLIEALFSLYGLVQGGRDFSASWFLFLLPIPLFVPLVIYLAGIVSGVILIRKGHRLHGWGLLALSATNVILSFWAEITLVGFIKF